MDEDQQFNIGDRVITLRRRGIFRVIALNGPIVTIESEKEGVRLALHKTALRRPLDEASTPGEA